MPPNRKRGAIRTGGADVSLIPSSWQLSIPMEAFHLDIDQTSFETQWVQHPELLAPLLSIMFCICYFAPTKPFPNSFGFWIVLI